MNVVLPKWAGVSGEATDYGVIFDGTYIYIALGTDPGVVVKIDPATMLEVGGVGNGRWTGVSGEYINDLASDGTYIYVCLGTDPGAVVKLNPATMLEMGGVGNGRWTGVSGESYGYYVSWDGTYVYVALGTDPGIVIQLNPATMLEVGGLGLSRWTGVSGDTVGALKSNATYTYVGLYQTPGVVIQLTPSTMLEYQRYTAGEFDDESIQSLALDNNYVYASFYSNGGGAVAQITPADMMEAKRWTGTTYPVSILSDGNYIYGCIGDWPNPGIVLKIDKTTTPMSTVDSLSGGTGEDSFFGLASDGTYIYAGVSIDPAEVVKIGVGGVSYALTTHVVGNGSITRVPNQSSYASGTPVTLEAMPDPGWRFDHWSGDLSGSDNPKIITMDADKDVTATFELLYQLTVNIVGNGSVTKDPDKSYYELNEVVTLTAVPDAGWGLDHWSGALSGSVNPTTITMDGDKIITATFVPLYQYHLTVNVSGYGTVTKVPNKVTYDPGEEVILTPSTVAGWLFDHWGGDASGSDNPLTVTMDSNKNITATFLRSYLIDTWTAPAGNNATALACDNTNLFVTLGSPNSYLYKLSCAELTTIDSMGPLSGRRGPYSLIFDGTYLFFGHGKNTGTWQWDNARLMKIQIDPFQYVSIWEAADSSWMSNAGYKSLTYDAVYVYFGVNYGPGLSRVVKITKATMAQGLMWTGAYEGLLTQGPCLCSDGTYIYAGCDLGAGNLAKIYKINPVTMTEVSHWTGAAGEERCIDVAFDGTYLYAALWISPGKMVQIDPVTMTTVRVWTGESGQNKCRALTVDSGYIYVGLETAPAQVIELDPATMLTRQNWTSAIFSYCYALSHDFIYAGLAGIPGNVVKLYFGLPLTVPVRSFGQIIG